MFKKGFYLILIILPLLVAACSPVGEDSIPWDKIEIKEEEVSGYLGSYIFERCWGFGSNRVCDPPETGSWTSDLELFLDRNRKICFGGFQEGTLYASSDYEWVPVRNQGRLCVQLQKKK